MLQKFLKCIAGIATAFYCVGATAETWYVAPNGSDTLHSGTNGWTNAFQTIAKGIASAGAGDLVLVSNGIYNAGISITKGVRVQAFSANPADTVIDAQAAGNCLTINHGDALCAGFTLTNGRARFGAGVLFNSLGGAVSNCIISGNLSCESGGGGIYMRTGLVANCVIAGNVSTSSVGGGVRILEGELRDCIISNNIATNCPAHMHGGGIHMQNGRIIRCDIVNNWCVNTPPLGGFGGGMSISAESTSALVSGCVFRANTAYSGGGGVYASGQNKTFVDCAFENNILLYAGSSGGALAISGGANYLDRCVLSGNTAGKGGGAWISTSLTLVMRNCLVNNNVASGYPGGGGLMLGSSIGEAGYISGCTIVSNIAKTYSGGGIRMAAQTNRIYNTIIYSNLALAYPDTDEIYHEVAASSNDYFNCCVSKPKLPPEAGNITNAPVFVDFHAGNFRQAPGSPGINAGTMQDWMSGASDLDGRRRLDYMTQTPDMGCYEYVFPGVMFLLR